MERIQRTLEVERIVNLVRGFGWDLVESKAEGETLRIVLEKRVGPAPPSA